MKKRLLKFLAVAGLVALTVVGCTNTTIDPAKVRAACASVDPSQKAKLEQGLKAIEAGKYNDALLPLREFAFGAKLDKSQVEIINDTIAKVRIKIAQTE